MRIKITVEKIPEDRFDKQGNDKMTLDISNEKDIFDFIPVLKLILIFISFPETTINAIFREDE
ncbi:MAG: hypothetical protein J7L03_01835 [Caldisericaceae bacterium]|nr:hypothetical protein [Caldisericaceae bacterium]